jgi:hypothetical protein
MSANIVKFSPKATSLSPIFERRPLTRLSHWKFRQERLKHTGILLKFEDHAELVEDGFGTIMLFEENGQHVGVRYEATAEQLKIKGSNWICVVELTAKGYVCTCGTVVEQIEIRPLNGMVLCRC